MKLLFITNVPSPYRVAFFNELGRHCDLTVCFERKAAADRDVKWAGTVSHSFRERYAKGKPLGTDKSIGWGVVRVLQTESFDRLIIAGYASPSVMLAIAYCRLRHIPYIIESDGAFFEEDRGIKRLLKRFLLCGARMQLTTCDEHIRYFHSLGIAPETVYKYPFTSVTEEDLQKAGYTDEPEKQTARTALGVAEPKMLLFVGQMIPRKGVDLLLRAVKQLPEQVGVYCVGGQPTAEYLALQETLKLSNIHYSSFQTKDELSLFYRAADCFVLPTREDIWGLVVNEAMSYGLPVVTTTRCNAGLELVTDGENGYIVPTEDVSTLAKALYRVLYEDDKTAMAQKSLCKIQQYTIEKMVQKHLELLT